jgi:hypothetical protein
VWTSVLEIFIFGDTKKPVFSAALENEGTLQ